MRCTVLYRAVPCCAVLELLGWPAGTHRCLAMPHHQMHIMKGRKRSRGFQSTAVCSRSLLVSVVLLLLLPLLLPAAASPSSPDNRIRLRSLNPDHSTESESEPRHLARRSTSVQHVCKCTCFSTNSTLIPLYAPVDPSKPCLTCTRQFCIDQNLDICKDAKLGDSDGDTATGFEGDVWAKCFGKFLALPPALPSRSGG